MLEAAGTFASYMKRTDFDVLTLLYYRVLRFMKYNFNRQFLNARSKKKSIIARLFFAPIEMEKKKKKEVSVPV